MPTFRNPFTRKDPTRGSTPVDGRLAMAGLVTPAGDVAVTPGVISGLTVSGRSTAPVWAYSVAGGHAVTTRGASDGANLTGLDGATDTPTVSAAPATGSRWDLIWIRQRDVDNGDPDSDAVIGVTSGTSGGSPSKPYGSVPTGALVLAEAQVSAGAANTADPLVTITAVAPRVAARGGIISGTTAQRDALTATATATNPLWFDVGGLLYRSNGTGWVPRSAPRRLGMNKFTTAGGVVVAGTPSWTTVATVTATSLGGLCVARADIIIANANSGVLRTGSFRVQLDGVTMTPPAGIDVTLPNTGTENMVDGGNEWESTPAAGTHTWTLQANGSAGGSARVWNATLVVTEWPA